METYYRNCSLHLIVILLYLFYGTQKTWKRNKIRVSPHTQFFCHQIWEKHDMWVLQNITWFRNVKHSRGKEKTEKDLCACVHGIFFFFLFWHCSPWFQNCPPLFLFLWRPVFSTLKSLLMLGHIFLFHLVSNFRSFSTNIFFIGWGCQPHAQHPTWRTSPLPCLI